MNVLIYETYILWDYCISRILLCENWRQFSDRERLNNVVTDENTTHDGELGRKVFFWRARQISEYVHDESRNSSAIFRAYFRNSLSLLVVLQDFIKRKKDKA